MAGDALHRPANQEPFWVEHPQLLGLYAVPEYAREPKSQPDLDDAEGDLVDVERDEWHSIFPEVAGNVRQNEESGDECERRIGNQTDAALVQL